MCTARVLWFTDARNGWIAGQHGTLLRTRDGGETWSAVPFPPSASGEARPYFFGGTWTDGTHGWLVGEHGAVLRTADGGDTWSLVDAGTRDAFFTAHRVRRSRRMDRRVPSGRRRPVRRLPDARRRRDVGARADAGRRGAARAPGPRRGHGVGRRRQGADRAAAAAAARRLVGALTVRGNGPSARARPGRRALPREGP